MKWFEVLLFASLAGVTAPTAMACITPEGINDAGGISFGDLNLPWQAVPPVPGIFQVG